MSESNARLRYPLSGTKHLARVWQYFIRDGDKKFGNDRSHKAAWCAKCFDAAVNGIVTSENTARLLDFGAVVRPIAEVDRAGKSF